MPLYRRKPTVVDAEQFTDPDNPPRGVIFFGRLALEPFMVVTMQGRSVPVDVGEWIVAEDDGVHFYPIDDEVFRKLYEAVGEA